MIIRKLKLHPFAGLTNTEIEFNENLSVICGPNEAGKSTTVKALWFALFVKTNLTPADEKKTIGRFLPVTGGDTIRISLDFSVDNKNYSLLKSWGGNKNSELRLPEGTIITNPLKVQEWLDNLLIYNSATYKNVLFTYQSELGKTFEKLTKEKEASISLSDLLRNAIMAQGGISAERFMQNLNEKEEDYFNNWDLKSDRPRKGKDIDDPHKIKIGFILEKYYAFRRFEEELKKTKEYEKQVDEAVKKIAETEGKLKTVQKFVKENKNAVRDARQRKNLETNRDKLKYEFENLNKIFSKWPRLETQISLLTDEKKKIEADLKKAIEELDNALKRDSLKSLEAKYKQASQLNDNLKVIEDKIKNSLKVEQSDIDIAVKIEQRIKNNRIRIEAQKLKLNLLAKENIQLQLRPGMEKMRNLSLSKGENKELELKGSFEIETSSVKISVLSGNENIEELQKQINDRNEELIAHLKKFNVSDPGALQSLLSNYQVLEVEMKQIKSNLDTILGGITFEELQNKMKEAGEIPLARETNLLHALNAECNEKIKSNKQRLEELQIEIGELNRKYTSHEKLSEIILEIKQLLKETDKTLSSLLPLPVDYSTADEFIDHFEKISEEAKQLETEHTDLRIHRIELDNNKPEYSTEELTTEIEIAKKELERKKKEGAAILKIKEKAEELIKSTETETYLPLQQIISRYFEEITNEKYHEVLLDGTLPVRIENNDKGFEIQQLSKGTLDALALATRLGMAEFYLTGTNGFLILDDPLVDLDENRQKSASRVLQKFAEKRQVIVFTCHRTHARIMQKEDKKMAFA